jgi:peptidoglycan/xylan/chitin deacetylase (PgdA/CDA1 family)
MNNRLSRYIKVIFIISTISIIAFSYNPKGMASEFQTNKKQVVLTFDDGPSYLYTEKILDILKTYKIKASFFLIGSKMIEYPDIVRRINIEGHSLGNHTYNHTRLDKYIDQRVDEEIAETNRVYENILGFAPKYFRPPGGRINKTVLSTVDHYGLVPIGWSINANDFLYTDQQVDVAFVNKKVASILALLEKDLKPGAIILMHNGNEISAAALPKVIEFIKSKGYQFTTLSQIM